MVKVLSIVGLGTELWMGHLINLHQPRLRELLEERALIGLKELLIPMKNRT